MVGNMTDAWLLLSDNGSVVPAVLATYQVSWGMWFIPVLFVATLGLVGVQTRNPAAVFIVNIIGLITLYGLIPPYASKVFYTTLVLSLLVTIYFFYGSPKTE
jgi:hypothetical protein